MEESGLGFKIHLKLKLRNSYNTISVANQDTLMILQKERNLEAKALVDETF